MILIRGDVCEIYEIDILGWVEGDKRKSFVYS